MPESKRKVKRPRGDISPGDLGEISVNGAQLADFIGISPAKVTRLRQARVIVQDSAGRYRLRDCVRAAYAYRNRLAEPPAPSDREADEAAKIHWQAENERFKNRLQRAEYGQELLEGFRLSVLAQVQATRDALGEIPGAAEILRSLASKLERVSLDSLVEGEDDSDAD